MRRVLDTIQILTLVVFHSSLFCFGGFSSIRLAMIKHDRSQQVGKLLQTIHIGLTIQEHDCHMAFRIQMKASNGLVLILHRFKLIKIIYYHVL